MIDFKKTQSSDAGSEVAPNKQWQYMEKDMIKIVDGLRVPNIEFKPQDVYNELQKYNTNYDRILYSTISNTIFGDYDQNGTSKIIGTILSNLDALLDMVNDPSFKPTLPSNAKKGVVEDTKSSIYKIRDHVSLAALQYSVLKPTDDEYDEKFKQRISEYKDNMIKDMNSQMITMVGIFTALAFLIFGSISSLDGIFENNDIPIFKVMSIGIVWGICVSNMIFVFMYCIGKMTKLSIQSDNRPDATVFQRYPVIWWTNLTLISMLMVSLWGYFIQQNKISAEVLSIVNGSPWVVFLAGSGIIILLIAVGIILVKRWTHKS